MKEGTQMVGWPYTGTLVCKGAAALANCGTAIFPWEADLCWISGFCYLSMSVLAGAKQRFEAYRSLEVGSRVSGLPPPHPQCLSPTELPPPGNEP